MSRHSSRKHSSDSVMLHFIFMPLIFSVLILGICYLVVAPQLESYASIAKMFILEEKPQNANESRNLFVPVPEVSYESEEKKPVDTTPKEVSIKDIDFPHVGDQFGELIIEDCQIDVKLFFGDSRPILEDGCGLYTGSFLPGFGGTILIAGHNNTYFNHLKYAEPGQKVKIRTSYGNYVYEITDIQVKHHTDKSAYDLAAKTENLIMYTCHPFDTLGLTPYRAFVYAKFISGPTVNEKVS